jgi:hypothetical protein
LFSLLASATFADTSCFDTSITFFDNAFVALSLAVSIVVEESELYEEELDEAEDEALEVLDSNDELLLRQLLLTEEDELELLESTFSGFELGADAFFAGPVAFRAISFSSGSSCRFDFSSLAGFDTTVASGFF